MTNFTTIRFGSNSTIIKSRNGEALGLDLIASQAPAIFAEQAHASRSLRYEFLNTRTALEGLIQAGFEVHEVRQGGSRIPGKRAFTKHMLRMRYRGGEGEAAVVGRQADRVIPEVIITNAHDGTASWQIGAGIFRIVCANGLVAGDLFAYERIAHNKAAPERVIDASFEVINQFPAVTESVREMAGLALSDRERLAFANAAQHLRWDDQAPVEVPALLAPKRSADRLTDLWTTMNVVQENVIRGGLRYTHRSEAGRVSCRETGEVRSIDENKRLNRALWTLADQMRQIKEAA